MSTQPQKRKRATAAQLQDRIEKVFIYLRQGLSEARIRAYLMEQEGCSEKTARRTIQSAWDLIGALGTQATDKQRGLLVARMNQLYAELTTGEQKNYNQAIKILQLCAQTLPKPSGGPVTHEPIAHTPPSGDHESSWINQIIENITGLEAVE